MSRSGSGRGPQVLVLTGPGADFVVPGVRERPDASPQSFTERSRRAFEITDTDEKLMAAAAIIGDSNIPVSG